MRYHIGIRYSLYQRSRLPDLVWRLHASLMTTKVVHCNQELYDIYIGRPSKWGNPFRIGKDGNRKEVLQKYQDWIGEQHELLKDLHELKGKTLGCHCAPKHCHGNILAKLADLLEE